MDVEEQQNIKSKTIVGVIWKFMERIIAQVVSLVVSIILARILDPKDYSAVAIITIFFNFANVIISGGLNTALIQKKDADIEDYSAVLHLSLLVSILIYVIFFFTAPWIAQLYELEGLVLIIRIMALSLPVYAIKSVLCAYISSTLQFRKFFFATLGGTLASAVVGIAMAQCGYGAWALVAQQTVNTVIDTIILFFTTRLHFVLKVSFSKLKVLFRYGWKVFVSSIITVVYNESTTLACGIKFTPSDLSYYTKGKSFPNLISTTTTSTLSAVLFPVLAKYQNDNEALLRYTRKFIRLASFIAFPAMLVFFAVADNFVSVILTDKWLPAVNFIRIFCLACMFDMIHIGNCETIKAMGRSDIFLIMEIIKKSGYFIIILMFLFLGNTPTVLACSALGCTVLAIIVNSIPNKKLIGYKYRYQVLDLLPNFLISLVVCATVYCIGFLSMNTFWLLVIQCLSGVVLYFVLNMLTRNRSFMEGIQLAKDFLRKSKEKELG